jgi:phospholipase D1/2
MTEPAILKPGDNCWRIEHADRVRFLVDGADYFRAFRKTARNARHSILLVGWDFDSRFELEREGSPDGLPTALGDFLETLVSRSKHLHVHILDWDFSMIYAPDREWLPLYKMDWTTHRRLHFRMDSRHPVGASHHQKIAVVDDRVAFVGGLDFALGRWDTCEHRPHDPRRRDADGAIAQPYHDIQMMVGGEVAAAVGELARRRWHTATGQRLRAPERSQYEDPWPGDMAPDLADVAVGVARTLPAYDGQQEVREIERLLVDAIAAARDCIYIENQYLTAHSLGNALARRLGEEDGPEITVILPEQTAGWLSQVTMDVLRERLLKRLYAADRHDRLRVYYPYVPGLGRQCVNVHAKAMIVDDRLLRVGSANFNNRSMGLDTECDLVIEAAGEQRIRGAIAGLRDRLLAEHLGLSPSDVAEAMTRHHSLLRTVETLRGTGRTLRSLPLRVADELDALVPDAIITDPESPVDTDLLARQLVADEDSAPARRTLFALASVLIVALVLAAAWRWTPLGEWIDVNVAISRLGDLRGEWMAPLVVILVYLGGSLVVFPITLLIIATGVAFGALYGFVYALVGAVTSAMITYQIGQLLGHKAIRSLSNRWVSRVSRRLARQGLLAIITLRVVPVAPFTVINLVAGASHIRFRDFAFGTLLGMAPGALALTVFSDQVVAAIATPETIRIVGLLILAFVIAAGSWWLGRWLIRRQQRKTDERRSRA